MIRYLRSPIPEDAGRWILQGEGMPPKVGEVVQVHNSKTVLLYRHPGEPQTVTAIRKVWTVSKGHSLGETRWQAEYKDSGASVRRLSHAENLGILNMQYRMKGRQIHFPTQAVGVRWETLQGGIKAISELRKFAQTDTEQRSQ